MKQLTLIPVFFGLILFCFCSYAGAVDIQVSNWGNLTDDQKAVVNAKIALWEGRLPAFRPPDHIVQLDLNNQYYGLLDYINSTPDAELICITIDEGAETLAVAGNFVHDSNKRPISGSIRFNTNADIVWYYGLNPPVPGSEYDFYTVVNHEMAHVLGFTKICDRFNDNIRANPNGSRDYNPNPELGEPTASLTPESMGTHTDPDVHAGDLMNPTVPSGERRTPSQLDEDIIEHNVWAKGKTSGGVKTGTKVHEIFWIHQNEFENGGATDLHFKIWQKEDNIGINGWKIEVEVGGEPAFDNVNGVRGNQPEPEHSNVFNVNGIKATNIADDGLHAIDVDCNAGNIQYCTWVKIKVTMWLTSWNTKRITNVEWTNTAVRTIALPAHGWTIGFPEYIGDGNYSHAFTISNDSDDDLTLSNIGLLASMTTYEDPEDCIDLIPIIIPLDTVLTTDEVLSIDVVTQGSFIDGHIYGKFNVGSGGGIFNFKDLFDHSVIGSPGPDIIVTPCSLPVDPTDTVLVSAKIIDDGPIVCDSMYVSTDGVTYVPFCHDSIAVDGITYWYTIGPKPEGTDVEYYVYAKDNDDNETESEIYSYIVTPYTPTGACCAAGQCFANNTEAECAALTGEWFIGESCPEFECPGGCYEYLPGDVNMSVYTWPPAYLSGDVTYLVNYFRGLPSSVPCKMYNPLAPTPDPGSCFFASADVNGSCTLVGADVTKLVNVFRGLAAPAYCADYEPCWPTPADLPGTPPASWPNCVVPCPPVTVTGERVIDTPDLGGK